MKYLILFFVLSTAIFSQDETENVKKVIMTMFDAMRENDAEKLKTVFAEKVDSYTIFVNKEGKPVQKSDDIQNFVKAVGQPKEKNEWDEKIHSYDIKVDGNLATVWTDYTFYHKGKRSHCGVNAFMLFNDGKSWKIYSLSDTRRRNNCKEDE